MKHTYKKECINMNKYRSSKLSNYMLDKNQIPRSIFNIIQLSYQEKNRYYNFKAKHKHYCNRNNNRDCIVCINYYHTSYRNYIYRSISYIHLQIYFYRYHRDNQLRNLNQLIDNNYSSKNYILLSYKNNNWNIYLHIYHMYQ